MIQVFIARVEHLPAGETLEQHATWQKEEAEIVKKDKENTDPRTGGLFKGVFNRRRQLFAVRDIDDGVDRCPLCGWELEAGECERCGLGFDENGMAMESSAGAFSDMDETTMDDMELEDYPDDGDYPEELDFEGYPELGEEYDPYGEEDQDFMMRRWLAAGEAVRSNLSYGIGPRQRAAHSVANSRRRYSASLVTEDMETLEEEDEEDEDSSMNDFIDDGETESGSQVTASTASQTPQPRANRGFQSRRGRRIVESESSSVSQATEEDEDEEDEGPIRPGRRNRQAHNRTLARANGSRGAASSTSTETSAVHELEEDTQALLREAGWSPLAHDGPEEMDEDGEESDGARTTVGWEPTANSNNRVPMAISLTPAADRPAHTTRQQANSGGRRVPDGSRGLRRRTSALSVSTVHYEDGEADDDDSEVDRDGDTNMSGSSGVRPRASRLRLRDQVQQSNRLANRGQAAGDAGDLDTDDNSDTSVVPSRRPNARVRQPEYDPRISMFFANYQNVLREVDLPAPFRYEPSRATTPIARPRTANRNRNVAQSRALPPVSPAPRGLPANAESRASSISAAQPIVPSNRRDSAEITSNQPSTMPPRSERSSSVSSRVSLPEGVQSDNGVRLGRESSVDSVNSASTITAASAPEVQASARGIPQSITAGPTDVIERPMSRLNAARPPSAAGRRNSGGYALGQGFPMAQGVGLNFAQRSAWPVQNRNPYWNFVAAQQMVAAAPRPRASQRTLREQSSTATLRASSSRRVLRPQGSRAEIRDGAVQAQNVRSPPSQFNLRPQQSTRRLNSQPSTRTLRAAHGVPSSPVAADNVSVANSRSSEMSEDERNRRVAEVIRARRQALGTTNPFTTNRRPSNVVANVGGHPPTVGQPLPRPGPATARFNAGESSPPGLAQPVPSTNTTPTSPTLGRRRSNRSLTLPPGAYATYQSPGYIRTRSGQVYGAPMESSAAPTTPTRGSIPVAATNYAT
jgi:hypothetical protein